MLSSIFLSRILLPPDHGCEMMGRGSPRLEESHRLSEAQGTPCHGRSANISLNAKKRWELISLTLHQTSSEQTWSYYKHGH